MFDFDKLKPAARRAAFAHMAAAKGAGKAAHQIHLSREYKRTGRASASDVDSLVKAYTIMHGKPPSAAQLARIRRAK